MICPMPPRAPSSSTDTTMTNAMDAARRRPLTMNGAAAGRRTPVRIRNLPHRKPRATSMDNLSTFLAPSTALM